MKKYGTIVVGLRIHSKPALQLGEVSSIGIIY